MPSTYTLISSNVLTASAASVTFSAIPGTYTDLVLRCSPRSDAANTNSYFFINFNGVSGTSYSETYIFGTPTSPTSGRNSSTNTVYGVVAEGNNNTANTFGSIEVYIPNYTSTTSKPMSAFSVIENNSSSSGASQIAADAILFTNSVAITSIAFTMNSSPNFVSGSSFYLYGIKNS